MTDNMVRFTGMESEEQTPEKVKQMYSAVLSMVHEGVDLGSCKVVDITNRAGIGKGTAYEYFETREDIIVAAIIYSTKKVKEWLNEELSTKEGFFRKVEAILNIIDENKQAAECLIRFLHMMTDNSVCGRKIREIGNREDFDSARVQTLLKEMVKEGIEKGELTKNLPQEYMESVVFSRILSFITFTFFQEKKVLATKEMKELLLQGLKAELRK